MRGESHAVESNASVFRILPRGRRGVTCEWIQDGAAVSKEETDTHTHTHTIYIYRMRQQ